MTGQGGRANHRGIVAIDSATPIRAGLPVRRRARCRSSNRRARPRLFAFNGLLREGDVGRVEKPASACCSLVDASTAFSRASWRC